jgi:hypothetical protein
MRPPTSATPEVKRAARRPQPAHLVLVPPVSEAPAPQLAAAQEPAPAAAGQAREVPPFARHLLTAIRVAMGLVFVVCGLNGFFDFLPRPDAALHNGHSALGHTLLLAGSMLPLLKGTEVLLETLLDLYQQLRARGAGPTPQFSPRSE